MARNEFQDLKPLSQGFGKGLPDQSIDEVISTNASAAGTGGTVPEELAFDDPGALRPDGIDFNSALWSGYPGQLRDKRGPR